MNDAPPVQYAKTSDGVNIAYLMLGDGPPVIFASNIYGDANLYLLKLPRIIQFPNELVSAGFRPILMDVRGMAGSDRDVEDLSLDARVRDIEAIAARVSEPRFAICGLDNGALTAIAYAAKHPERVSHLLLFMPWRSFEARRLASTATQAISAMTPRTDEEWDVWAKVVGSVATNFQDSEEARQMAAAIRDASTPPQRAVYMKATSLIDVTDLLPRVEAPTLVLHHPGASFVPHEISRDVATRISGAQFAVINDPHTLPIIIDFLRAEPRHTPASEAPAGAADALSAREIEVLKLLAQGKTNPEIAADLFISRNTVQNHVSSILTKANLTNRAQAAAYAQRHGIV